MEATLNAFGAAQWAADYVRSEEEPQVDTEHPLVSAMLKGAHLNAIRATSTETRRSFAEHVEASQAEAAGLLDQLTKLVPSSNTQKEILASLAAIVREMNKLRADVAALKGVPSKPLPPTPEAKPVPQRAGPPPPPPPAPPVFRTRITAPPRSPRARPAPPPVPQRTGPVLGDAQVAVFLAKRRAMVDDSGDKPETAQDWGASLDQAMAEMIIDATCRAGQIHSKCY